MPQIKNFLKPKSPKSLGYNTFQMALAASKTRNPAGNNVSNHK